MQAEVQRSTGQIVGFAVPAATSFSVQSITPATKTVVVSGKLLATAGQNVTLSGTTASDGIYTIASASYNSGTGNTTIVLTSSTGLATQTTTGNAYPPGIDFSGSSAGEVRALAGSSITGLTWYSGDLISGPWYASQDAPASVVAAGQSCIIPAALFACAFILPVGNAAGTVNLDLKS